MGYKIAALEFGNEFLDIFYTENDLKEIQLSKVKNLGFTKKGRKLNLYQYELDPENGYPVYSSKTFNEGILGYLPTYDYDMEAITWNIVGEAGTIFYRNGKFTINDNCGLLTITSDKVVPKYLYYVLSLNSKNYVNYNSTLPMMNCNNIDDMDVPLLKKDIQLKIVKFLDTFSTYTDDIIIGLPAEIRAREKQYKYYCQQLLDFDSWTDLKNH